MKKNYQKVGTSGVKETTGLTAPIASNALGMNVFTAPGKTMVGGRPRPFGEALLGDPGHQTLPAGLRSGAENRDVRPAAVRSDDGAIPRLGSQSVMVEMFGFPMA